MANKQVIEKLRAMVREIEKNDSTTSVSSRPQAISHPQPVCLDVRDQDELREVVALYETETVPWLEPCLPSSLEGFRTLEPGLGSLDNWLYLDIETTGLIGAATFAFLVGLGEWRKDGFSVTQYLLTDRGGEESLLQAVREAIDGHPTLVTFNGKTFDMPVLRSRFVISGIRPPAGPSTHLDLLALARNMGKRPEYGCGLKDSVERFAGVARGGDIPGKLIPALYFIYEREKDVAILDPVLKHNRLDVLDMACLARVFGAVVTAQKDRPQDSLALSGAGKLHYRKGNFDLARKCLETASAEGQCPPDKRALLARILRRQGDWDGARRIWEESISSGLGTVEDYLWLARYHEVAGKDLKTSLEIVEKAMKRYTGDLEPPKSLLRRRARLMRRLEAARKRS